MPPSSIDADLGPYFEDMIDAAESRMQDLKAQFKMDAPHSILSGPTADSVCQEAICRKADLIIAGRGRANARLSRIWSHLYQIVRESPCPVLSI
jgi:nucleotide-binding universal stress UspA family protein